MFEYRFNFVFLGYNGLVFVCINLILNFKFFLKCYCLLNLYIYFLLIEWYICMVVIIKFFFEGCIFSKKWFKSVCVREMLCYWRSSCDGGDRIRLIYILSRFNFNFKIIWFWEVLKYKFFCDLVLFEYFVLNFLLNFVYRF